jgi:hypothetical protein
MLFQRPGWDIHALSIPADLGREGLKVLMVLIVRELVPLGTVDPEGGRESVI